MSAEAPYRNLPLFRFVGNLGNKRTYGDFGRKTKFSRPGNFGSDNPNPCWFLRLTKGELGRFVRKALWGKDLERIEMSEGSYEGDS